jgi:flagellar biosynthesis protein FliQ
MNIELAIEIFQNLIFTSFMLISPILGTAIVIGVLVSLLQTVTSIQEQSLVFVPKLLGVGLVLVFISNWMMRGIMDYSIQIIQRMAEMGN